MKRSGFITRTKPMKRSGFKSSPIRIEPDAFKTSVKVKRMKGRPKRKTKAEREHMGVVAGYFCIVCRNLRLGESPAELHHPRFLAGGAQRSGHLDVIALCPNHHRLGGYGVAFHAGPEIWQQKYGTEAQLLEQTKRELGINQPLEEVAQCD